MGGLSARRRRKRSRNRGSQDQGQGQGPRRRKRGNRIIDIGTITGIETNRMRSPDINHGITPARGRGPPPNPNPKTIIKATSSFFPNSMKKIISRFSTLANK